MAPTNRSKTYCPQAKNALRLLRMLLIPFPEYLPHRDNNGSDQEQQDRKGAEGSDV